MANLISVPFQNNFNFNTGTKNATVWILNVQPVIPIPITDDLNLITRTIRPIVNQPPLFSVGDTDAFGLGDINPTVFLSPAKPGKLIWGVGPTMTLPTATVSRLGSGRWAAGPAAVGLFMDGPWVVGALAHARSGAPAQISRYLGKRDHFDNAIAEFSFAYADQSERDHEVLRKAVKAGHVEVVMESE